MIALSPSSLKSVVPKWLSKRHGIAEESLLPDDNGCLRSVATATYL